MTGHQMREMQVFWALREIVSKTYGVVPTSVIQEAAAHVIADVILWQAQRENELRNEAAKGGFDSDAADAVAALHAPIGGRA